MNKKLKIAIIGSRGYPYVYSGYETLVKELSERLVKKGHNITVYCHRSLFKHRPQNINGVDLIYTPSVETKFLSQIVNSFFSFIHVCFSKSDVVLIVNTSNGPFGILTRLFKKKTCINVDGLEWLRPKWKGLGSMYFKIGTKLSVLFFDKLITDCNEMKKVYLKKYRCNSTVISYGSTMTNFGDNDILKKHKIISKKYYLIVGRLIPDNNSHLIIDGLLLSDSTMQIVVVGDVPYEDKYATMIKENASKKIIFTGYVNCQKELTALYKNCFAYFHGHEFGGTNPTMINALDINCSIIALDTPFNREMLLNKEAIYFKKNSNSLKSAINFFEKNYHIFENNNKDYKLSKIYEWDYIANQYLKLFKKIS